MGLISGPPLVHYWEMQKHRLRLLVPAIACAAALSLASCATFQRWGDEGAVRQVTGEMKAANAPALAARSVTPFLLDGEIVLIPSDVADFWNGVLKAGFRMDNATLDAGAAVGPLSYQKFADTMEVKAFFSRYVKSGSRILELATGTGTHVLLLVKSDWFQWKVIGLKGPY